MTLSACRGKVSERVTDTVTPVTRPAFAITTDKAFDASGIAAYASEHHKVYAHIDAHIDQHLAELQSWMRQPSGSAENLGVRDMAELLRQDFEDLGFAEAELVETDGHPGVWGYYDAGAEKTLMVYMMYDVQPVNPDDWRSPPFAAEIVDVEQGRAIMVRPSSKGSIPRFKGSSGS